MPGHIKLVKVQADPDPTEFLLPSIEAKRADQQKQYDSKKSVWISNPKDGGYREGLPESGGSLENLVLARQRTPRKSSLILPWLLLIVEEVRGESFS